MKTQESTAATVAGIAASFCTGVVIHRTLRGVLAACASINPVISFVGITALSITVEDRVANHVAKVTQETIDAVKDSWNKSEDSK